MPLTYHQPDDCRFESRADPFRQISDDKGVYKEESLAGLVESRLA